MPNTISNLEDHVGYWLRFVSNHVSQAFARKLEAKDITVAEWVLLREMFAVGAANPSQLADKIGLTRGAVSKLVERVCTKKLAVRTDSKSDRRFQTVALTAKGKKLLPQLARLADANDDEFFGHLAAKQKTSLVEQLKDLIQRHGWKDSPVD